MTSPRTGAARKLMFRVAAGFKLVPLLFLAALPLLSQETTGTYFVRQSETGEQTIVQRLSWPEDENASRYEVVVERRDGDAFAEIHRESTEGIYIEISLGPGRYRYHVRVFNLLNQAEYSTNWASFDIILALQPEIGSYTPDILYVYEDYRWDLRITGENLVEGGEAFFVPLEDPENPETLENPDAPIAPKEYLPAGETALLVFNPADLRPGAYRILVRNPGGLEASAEPVRIEHFRPPELEFSAGYAPLLPLYGYLFDTFDGFAPSGMDLRLSFVFYKQPWGFLGLETNFYFHQLSADGLTTEISALITGGELSILYRKLLPLRQLVFNARLGTGLSAAPFNLVFEYKNYTSDPLTSWVPMVVTGVSLEWRFLPFLYAELGTDMVHLFSRDTPQPGFLRPFFNLGGKFLFPGKE